MSTDPKPLSGNPIQGWRIRNFKSISKADVNLAPLTLVMGSNSSGKSSLIQSILLLVQAAQGRQLADSVPLNGPIVSLGRFDDVLSKWSSRRQIEIGATVSSFLPDIQIDQSLPGRALRGRPFGRLPQGALAGPERERQVDWDLVLKGRSKVQSGSADIDSVRIILKQAPRILLQAKRRQVSERDIVAFERGRRFRRATYSPAVPFVRGLEFSLNYQGTFKSDDYQAPIEGLQMRAGLHLDALVPARHSDLLADDWLNELMC